MVSMIQERPGAITLWGAINSMLAPDERFEIQSPQSLQILLAPKHSSKLAALLFHLRQEKIAFAIEGEGAASAFPLIVSSRALLNLTFHDYGVLEAGAGSTLTEVNQFLYQYKQEVAWEDEPLSFSKCSIGELLLSGRFSGSRLHQESFLESLLGVELVTLEGSQVKWGGMHKGGTFGPQLQRLLPGFNSFPGILVKLVLKTYPMPPCRLRLSWVFYDRAELRRHFYSLKSFSSSWEILDCVFSGNEGDKSFIFAQISGIEDELKLFAKECPDFLLQCKVESGFKRKGFCNKNN